MTNARPSLMQALGDGFGVVVLFHRVGHEAATAVRWVAWVPWVILGTLLVGTASLGILMSMTDTFVEDIGGEPQVRPWARNETASALTFETLSAGEWHEIGTLDAGEEGRVVAPETRGLTDGSGCTVGRVRAVDQEGYEVARWPREHLCASDRDWVIR